MANDEQKQAVVKTKETTRENLVALVTGATSGIGREIVNAFIKKKQIKTIYFTSTTQAKGEKQLKAFDSEKVKYHVLQCADKASIAQLIKDIEHVDILVNNAGLFLPTDHFAHSVFKVSTEDIEKLYKINTLAPLQLMQNYVPKMMLNGFGRVVNISSGTGQLSDMGGTATSYRLSKVSLNALTKIFNAEVPKYKNVEPYKGKDWDLKINTVCVGFCNTNLTKGLGAPRTPAKGAECPVELSICDKDGPTNLFFRDMKVLDW